MQIFSAIFFAFCVRKDQKRALEMIQDDARQYNQELIIIKLPTNIQNREMIMVEILKFLENNLITY